VVGYGLARMLNESAGDDADNTTPYRDGARP